MRNAEWVIKGGRREGGEGRRGRLRMMITIMAAALFTLTFQESTRNNFAASALQEQEFNYRTYGGSTYREKPAYKLTFEVSYNISEPITKRPPTPRPGNFTQAPHPSTTPLFTARHKLVSNVCGEFYARTFLENFITLEDWLNNLCSSSSSSPAGGGGTRSQRGGGTATARVQVYPLVVVRIFDNLVKIETSLNISLRHASDPGGGGGSRADVRNCATAVNVSLRSAAGLDVALTQIVDGGSGFSTDSRKRQLTEIHSHNNCSDARMSPAMFIPLETSWICRDNLTVIGPPNWGCYTGEELSSQRSTVPARNRATSTVRTTTIPFSRSRTTSDDTRPFLLNMSSLSTGLRQVLLTSEGYLPDVTTSSVVTERKEDVKKPAWKIEVLNETSRIYLSEGLRPFDLPIRVSYNWRDLCGTGTGGGEGGREGRGGEVDCYITLDVAFVPVEFPVDPICRRTGQTIPQLVISRPSVVGQQSVNISDNFCSINIHHHHPQSVPPIPTQPTPLPLPHSPNSMTLTTPDVTSSHDVTRLDVMKHPDVARNHDIVTSPGVMTSVDVHLYIKAMIDQKYDGLQIRNLTLALTRHLVPHRKKDQGLGRGLGRSERALRQEEREDRRVGEEWSGTEGEEKEEEDVHSETLLRIPVFVEDRDRKATCQSINDPHVTTFDGLEYNNFLEGEFVLYKHIALPFSVQAIYQHCHENVSASCNCAVAVQSDDDVLVIDRCVRKALPTPLPRVAWGVATEVGGGGGGSEGPSPPASKMIVRLYLNGKLTAGTRFFRDATGMKYSIFLPHGALVKVLVSGSLINVWVVPSPADLHLTVGLCGRYDWKRQNDLHLRNDSDLNVDNSSGSRPQPAQFINDWRVNMTNSESLFRGLEPSVKPYEPTRYCECVQNGRAEGTGRSDKGPGMTSRCDYAADVSNCDVYEGVDVTKELVSRAITPSSSSSRAKLLRRKRGVRDNSVLTPFDDDADDRPIIINKKSNQSPKMSWHKGWNEVTAKDFCRQHVRDGYKIGQLCSLIPTVNFQQEITTCVEDIQITGNTTWADSARDAMKEQCIEEVQKNGSLPNYIVDGVYSEATCLGDCNNRGVCLHGICRCTVAGYSSSSNCAVTETTAPTLFEMPRYGLCDMRYVDCSSVIIYGNNFINSPNLTCHLQEVKVTEQSYFPIDGVMTTTRSAVFINFNEVTCPLTTKRSYLISVSNNGVNASASLLFIPFDSACSTCNIFNSTCVKQRNSCIIDSRCYREGETSEADRCLVCKAFDDEFQWSAITESRCRPAWWEDIQLPDWVVALVAAIGGSLIGIVIGFLLYRCCCRNIKSGSSEDIPRHGSRMPSPTRTLFQDEDTILHRSLVLPSLAHNHFTDLELPRAGGPAVALGGGGREGDEREQDTSLFFNDGRGVETGLDSTTYF